MWLLCLWNFPSKNTGLGFHLLTSGDLPDSGIKLTSPASPVVAGGFFTTEPPGKPHLQAIPTSNSRIHILFKCAWNVLLDDHKLGHKTSFDKFKMIETISSISLITMVWNYKLLQEEQWEKHRPVEVKPHY